ncbi:C40 family peptidase [Marilutibacter spongiae]|uniref:C40 family peptidase n=1 Tax=Marilutibacter spongiae TaxID=2025720 RepID=A0A7W3Y5V5_9GAMM|nr:NlpC/P60 family protein [Lysobacter spongiae]MBB1060434.1 C40 family peptidase [Lysobacter spongiae]
MSRVVSQARTWLGVRYLHQGRNRFGVDCVGMPHGVYRELGVDLPDFRAYGTEADPAELLARLRAALGDEVAIAPISAASLLPGDIVVFHFPRSGIPRHLGIVADRAGGGLNFIESNGNEGRVIERRLDDRYRARITHVFRRPV